MKRTLGCLLRLPRMAADARLTLHAAGCSFFLVLSLFPALLVVLSLLRATPLLPSDLTPYLESYLPQALLPEVEYLIAGAWYAAPKTLVGFSALTALWSSSRGVLGLARGLNGVWGETEYRPWLHARLASVLYTFGFFLLLLLTLVLHVTGEGLGRWLGGSPVRFLRFLGWLLGLRGVVLPALQILLFSGVYCLLPRRQLPFRDALPGAVTAALGWQLFSRLFTAYVEHFCGYANIYGSVYALALGLLWLYVCVLILLFGALLNRVLSE